MNSINTFLSAIKQRRLALGLKQKDMFMRIGMSRQQYQNLESKGNPRLETLLQLAEGLDAELVLVPREKAEAIKDILTPRDDSQPAPEVVTSDDSSPMPRTKGLPEVPAHLAALLESDTVRRMLEEHEQTQGVLSPEFRETLARIEKIMSPLKK